MTTKQKDPLDRFYTKPSVARMCVNRVLGITGEGADFTEPSAGNGSFLEFLPYNTRKGYDIHPCHQEILEKDYLSISPPKGVVIGNPPFGKRNSLTKAFIRHSLNADMIAFILPSVFRKETMQKVFPDNWKLVEDITLPENSFLFEGESYHVPCVFQIWVNKEGVYGDIGEDLRASSKEAKTTTDFTFTTKKDGEWFQFGASPSRIIPAKDVDKNNRGYYIKDASQEVLDILKVIPWKEVALSSVSGGVAWFTKAQIVDAYLNYKGEQHGSK